MQQSPRKPARTLSLDDFLRVIIKSGLLTKEQLQTAIKSLPADQRTQLTPVTDLLIKQGKLSRFQARKLMQGNYRGLLLGPFQVLAPIGRGGMGAVYLARDHRSAQLLALKVLPPERARSEERILERFRREMEMNRKVSHPHIAWAIDWGKSEGVYYLAMEYIPGKSLHRLVAEQGPLSVTRAALLGSEVTLALEHLHDQGLVHRDIKPANIMVTPNNHAKLLDLGLALVRGETGSAKEVIGGQGYVVGTMDYIAPEQTDDPTKVDGRADLYALGATLYYALTGQLPYPGGGNKEKMQRAREEQPRPLLELNPAATPEIVVVVNRLMAKDPAQRYQTAAEAREDLRRCAGGQQLTVVEKPTDLVVQEEAAKLESAEPVEDIDILPPTDAVPPSEASAVAPVEPPVAQVPPEPALWQRPTFRVGLVMFLAGMVAGALLVLLLNR